MDENPYQAPEHVGPARRRNPLIIGAISFLAVVVAADLILGGIVKMFVWGIGSGAHPQIAFGAIHLAAGVLILERLARYLRILDQLERNLAATVTTVLIWGVIAAGVAIEVISLVLSVSSRMSGALICGQNLGNN